jgi:EAL domain-containing protein (putative c-di-GMP-specific phosphodiesterase class I)
MDTVTVLKQLGIKIAIDNVLYGHSPVESLILLKPDYIKIDGGNVSGISIDQRKQESVRRIVEVARVLGASVIAQDIETKGDLECLKKLAVDYGQGAYFGFSA